MEGPKIQRESISRNSAERLKKDALDSCLKEVISQLNATLSANILMIAADKMSHAQSEQLVESICIGRGNDNGHISQMILDNGQPLLKYLSSRGTERLVDDVIEKGEYLVVEALADRLRSIGLNGYEPRVRAALKKLHKLDA